MFWKDWKEKNNKKQAKVGITNTRDSFGIQVGIINNFNSLEVGDKNNNNGDSDNGSIGILNEEGAINYGTQVDIQTFYELE